MQLVNQEEIVFHSFRSWLFSPDYLHQFRTLLFPAQDQTSCQKFESERKSVSITILLFSFFCVFDLLKISYFFNFLKVSQPCSIIEASFECCFSRWCSTVAPTEWRHTLVLPAALDSVRLTLGYSRGPDRYGFFNQAFEKFWAFWGDLNWFFDFWFFKSKLIF